MQEVLGMNQSFRLILKQCIATPTGPPAGIARNNPYGAVELARPARRYQRSAAVRTLHHHKRLGKGHKPTVPSRKMSWLNATARAGCAQQQPMLGNLPLQRSMMGGINTIQRCPQNSDGSSVPSQTATMGCSINPFGKPAEHRPANLGESTTKLFSHREAMIRGGPRAHHRYSFAVIQMVKQRSLSLDVQPGRR